MTQLNDLGVPGWLMNIIKGFFEERALIVNFNGKKSGSKALPGVGPQENKLGMFNFLVLLNDAGFPEENGELGEKKHKLKTKQKLSLKALEVCL